MRPALGGSSCWEKDCHSEAPPVLGAPQLLLRTLLELCHLLLTSSTVALTFFGVGSGHGLNSDGVVAPHSDVPNHHSPCLAPHCLVDGLRVLHARHCITGQAQKARAQRPLELNHLEGR